jgi:hypothetical protein
VADQKISALTQAQPLATDILPYVSDPLVTPTTKQTLLSALHASVAGLLLLEEHVASASASLDFKTRNKSGLTGNLIQTDFDEYLLELLNLVPTTNAQPLWLRVSTDGGGTFDSGANYSYGQMAWTAATNAFAGATGATKIILTISNLSNSANWGITGRVHLYSPGSAIFKQIDGSLHILDSASTRAKNEVFGAYEVATAVNAFQLLFASGTIASGTARCYGVRK